MKKSVFIYFIFLFTVWLLPFSYADTSKIIKFATIAPEGSTWTNVIRDIDEEIQTKSKGRMRLKIYAGGAMGDEIDVIRKMRVSQIHCAALTSLGLAKILPETRILDLPLFYRNSDEINFIKSELFDYFYKAFDDKGYVLLGWSELGFICFFSKKEIKFMSELRSTNMWLWEGDPLAKTLFSLLELSPIPLSLPNVASSMQTGLIDSVYGSPLAVIALNWFDQIKYMLDIPIANATGALLIQKKYYKKLSPDLQEVLKDAFKNKLASLPQLICEDNARSKEVMRKYGVKTIHPDDNIIKEFKHASMKTCELLSGKLYPNELLNVVISKLEEYRNNNNLQNIEESYVVHTKDIINNMKYAR